MRIKGFNWPQILSILILLIGIYIGTFFGYKLGTEKDIIIFNYEISYKFSFLAAYTPYLISIISATFFYAIGTIIEQLDLIYEKLSENKD